MLRSIFYAIISGFLLLSGCNNPKSTPGIKNILMKLNIRMPKTCEASGDDSQDYEGKREARFELKTKGNAKVPVFINEGEAPCPVVFLLVWTKTSWMD
jgi:hypothetical protein